MRWLLRLLFGTILSAAAAGADETPDVQPAFDASENYQERTFEGWPVLVNRRLLADERRELAERALARLADHLYRIRTVVPADPLGELERVPIWVEWRHPLHPGMCYHPDAEWLREHGMNPAKARSVEVSNVDNFLAWSLEQPWMVLHELAHAYHHRVLGFDHAPIREAYRRAVESRRYEAVLRANGRRERAYALTDEKEYFAETTEAFFGTNDFAPFVRAELAELDPEMHALLRQVWRLDGGGTPIP